MESSAFLHTRRFERRPQRLHLTLLGKTMGLEHEQPATTVNVSKRGLRIRTDDAINPARPLEPGQVLFVYGVGNVSLGYCRVVWVHTDGPECPGEAGLEFLH